MGRWTSDWSARSRLDVAGPTLTDQGDRLKVGSNEGGCLALLVLALWWLESLPLLLFLEMALVVGREDT